MTSRNWEVVYRCQDSLATCNIWAPDEAQAEKKFRARPEFEYDPEYDREDDGNIRSIYPTPDRPLPAKKIKLSELEMFCLPPDIYNWLRQYPAPEQEEAFAKDIPNTDFNHKMTDRLARYVQIRRKYRGSSIYSDDCRIKIYQRPRDYCHKKFADRFALYNR